MFVVKHSCKQNLIPLFKIALLIALFLFTSLFFTIVQALNITYCSVQYFYFILLKVKKKGERMTNNANS